MSRICFVDLDRVVAENSEREVLAMEFANSRFVPEKGIIPSVVYTDAWKKIFYSERAFYNPEWIALDTLMEGAVEALVALEWQYRVIYLTSRPESLRNATNAWLYQHQVYSTVNSADRLMVMKAEAFKYIKTVVWKVGMVQTLHRLYGADSVLVVDDSPDIRQAVLDAYPDGGDFGLVQVAASLDEAVKLVVKQ